MSNSNASSVKRKLHTIELIISFLTVIISLVTTVFDFVQVGKVSGQVEKTLKQVNIVSGQVEKTLKQVNIVSGPTITLTPADEALARALDKVERALDKVESALTQARTQGEKALRVETSIAVLSDIAEARLRLAEEVEENGGVSPCEGNVNLIDYITRVETAVVAINQIGTFDQIAPLLEEPVCYAYLWISWYAKNIPSYGNRFIDLPAKLGNNFGSDNADNPDPSFCETKMQEFRAIGADRISPSDRCVNL